MLRPETNPPRRRPYVIRACNECRRRRCRCDGEQPVCGTCSASGHECSWDPDTEASRPFTKQYIESLRVKVQLLESQIAQLRAGNPTPSTSYPLGEPSPSSFSQEPLDELQNSPDPSDLSSQYSTSLPPSTTGVSGYFSVTMQNVLEPLKSNLSLFPLPKHVSSPLASSRPFGPHMTSPTTAFQYQYIINIDPSTPLGHQAPETQASLYCQWDRHLPDLGQAQLTRADHDEMLSRYFGYGMSWLSGLVPALFLRDMLGSLGQQTTPTSYLTNYSPLLHCSLLALVSSISENPLVRAKETRVKFTTQAKNWLYDHFSDFHPTLLPSLMLLAEYHKGIGEVNTSYMYLGGQNYTLSNTVETNHDYLEEWEFVQLASAILTTNPAHVWFCWLIYAQEALSALECGRPNEMPAPITPIDFIPENWDEHSSIVAETFVHSCKLSAIATKVSRNRQNDDSVLTSLQLILDSWFNSLPDRLLVRQRAASTHSHVLCLHISYWWITLRLYIPLYKQDRPKDSGSGLNGDRLFKMCNRATEKLVQLFSEFDKQYNLRYFPGTLLQAIVLCGDALLLERAQAPDGAPKRRAKAQEGIDSCVRALQLAGETWQRALNLAAELQTRATA